MLLALLAIVMGIRLWTESAIPGWATYTAGLLVLLSVQLVGISFNLAFVLISNRSRTVFVPIRDYHVYIDKVEGLSAETGRPV